MTKQDSIDFDQLAALLAEIEAVSPANASQPLTVPVGDTDLSKVITQFNSALTRLDNGYSSLRRFIWDAAHQLRTPLAVLAARLSMNTPPDISEIQHDLEWMSRLVGQLLSAARASESRMDNRKSIDLGLLAQDVVSALAPLAIYRGRMLELIADENDKVIIQADRGFAFEALSNLVENAMSHAPELSIISVHVKQPGIAEVSDTGSGVPIEHRDRIFRPFEQGPIPTKGGAGLGLSIVKEIMFQHKGSVSYRDGEPNGAVFILTFGGTLTE